MQRRRRQLTKSSSNKIYGQTLDKLNGQLQARILGVELMRDMRDEQYVDAY